MEFRSKITGADQLEKVLSNMPRATRRKASRQALRAGGRVVKEAATNNIRKQFKSHTGVLAKKSSIVVYNARNSRGNMRVLVSVRRGLINKTMRVKNKKTGTVENVRVGLYASVGEYGSEKLNRRPRPWARPAARENENATVSAVRDEFSKRINDIVKDAKSL